MFQTSEIPASNEPASDEIDVFINSLTDEIDVFINSLTNESMNLNIVAAGELIPMLSKITTWIESLALSADQKTDLKKNLNLEYLREKFTAFASINSLEQKKLRPYVHPDRLKHNLQQVKLTDSQLCELSPLYSELERKIKRVIQKTQSTLPSTQILTEGRTFFSIFLEKRIPFLSAYWVPRSALSEFTNEDIQVLKETLSEPGMEDCSVSRKIQSVDDLAALRALSFTAYEIGELSFYLMDNQALCAKLVPNENANKRNIYEQLIQAISPILQSLESQVERIAESIAESKNDMPCTLYYVNFLFDLIFKDLKIQKEQLNSFSQIIIKAEAEAFDEMEKTIKSYLDQSSLLALFLPRINEAEAEAKAELVLNEAKETVIKHVAIALAVPLAPEVLAEEAQKIAESTKNQMQEAFAKLINGQPPAVLKKIQLRIKTEAETTKNQSAEEKVGSYIRFIKFCILSPKIIKELLKLLINMPSSDKLVFSEKVIGASMMAMANHPNDNLIMEFYDHMDQRFGEGLKEKLFSLPFSFKSEEKIIEDFEAEFGVEPGQLPEEITNSINACRTISWLMWPSARTTALQKAYETVATELTTLRKELNDCSIIDAAALKKLKDYTLEATAKNAAEAEPAQQDKSRKKRKYIFSMYFIPSITIIPKIIAKITSSIPRAITSFIIRFFITTPLLLLLLQPALPIALFNSRLCMFLLRLNSGFGFYPLLTSVLLLSSFQLMPTSLIITMISVTSLIITMISVKVINLFFANKIQRFIDRNLPFLNTISDYLNDFNAQYTIPMISSILKSRIMVSIFTLLDLCASLHQFIDNFATTIILKPKVIIDNSIVDFLRSAAGAAISYCMQGKKPTANSAKPRAFQEPSVHSGADPEEPSANLAAPAEALTKTPTRILHFRAQERTPLTEEERYPISAQMIDID